MYSRFHYILILLVAIVVYLIYLIGYYKVQEYETGAFITSLKTQSELAKRRNEEKTLVSMLIHTPAYETLVAKATQNKKLPGEDVINIVTPEDVNGNTDIDPRTVISNVRTEQEDPTRGMTNPEKWIWLIQNQHIQF